MGVVRKNGHEEAQWQWLPVENCEYISAKYSTTARMRAQKD